MYTSLSLSIYIYIYTYFLGLLLHVPDGAFSTPRATVRAWQHGGEPAQDTAARLKIWPRAPVSCPFVSLARQTTFSKDDSVSMELGLGRGGHGKWSLLLRSSSSIYSRHLSRDLRGTSA